VAVRFCASAVMKIGAVVSLRLIGTAGALDCVLHQGARGQIAQFGKHPPCPKQFSLK
jgi:hypothetical protein